MKLNARGVSMNQAQGLGIDRQADDAAPTTADADAAPTTAANNATLALAPVHEPRVQEACEHQSSPCHHSGGTWCVATQEESLF